MIDSTKWKESLQTYTVSPAFSAPIRDNYSLKSHKYVCITTYQPDTKSNPKPNPTTKQHAIANIQLNVVVCRPTTYHSGTLASSSVNGDIAIQCELSNFDPSQNPNPYDKTLHNWLRPRDEHVGLWWIILFDQTPFIYVSRFMFNNVSFIWYDLSNHGVIRVGKKGVYHSVSDFIGVRWWHRSWLNVDDVGTAGQVSGPQKMQHIVDRNQEVLNNFIKSIEELAILRDNLFKKEVRHVRSLYKITLYSFINNNIAAPRPDCKIHMEM